MAVYKYIPRGVCSREIVLDISEDGVINEVTFNGGCAGNTSGISSLVKGMQAKEVIQRLKGTDCRGRGTSCPDQLAQALENALSQ